MRYKKIIIAIVILSAIGLLYFMSPKNNNSKATVEKTSEVNPSDKKILVAYFSRAGENYAVGNVEKGNTQIMAENIAQLTGGDLYAIEPVHPYPSDYDETKDITLEELESQARPEIKNQIANFDEYDIVFIGYPIWHGDYPMIMNTFMESQDFTNKTIIPFNTHEGSESAGTYEEIKNKLPTATVLEGLAMRGSEAREDSSQKTIKAWLEQLQNDKLF